MRVTLTREAGARDPRSPHVVHLGAPCEAAGAYELEIPALNAAADASSWPAHRVVERVASCGGAKVGLQPVDLRPRAQYRLVLSYRCAASGQERVSDGVRAICGHGRFLATRDLKLRAGLSRLNRPTGTLRAGTRFVATEKSAGHGPPRAAERACGGAAAEGSASAAAVGDPAGSSIAPCLRVDGGGWIDALDRETGEPCVERVPACSLARIVRGPEQF